MKSQIDSIYEQPLSRWGLFSPFRTSRDFLALWLGQSLSLFGDSVLWVTMPLAIFHTSSSTLQLGIVMGLFMLPQIVLLPFTGIFVDRVSRVRIMILTDIVRCFLVLLLAGMYVLGRMDIRMVDAFVLVYGAMDALFNPAASGARQQVFTHDIRNAAISLMQMSAQMARLLGPAVGGLIVGVASPSAGFVLDACMLLASVVSLTCLRISSPKKNEPTKQGVRIYISELLGGYKELRKQPWLWITILAFAFLSIASNGLTTILVPWLVKVHLHFTDLAYGLVNSASGVGAIVAAFLYGRRPRWRHRAYIAYGGLATNAISIFCLSFVQTPTMLMIWMAIASAGSMLFGVVWEGSMQELVAPEAYGRASALDYFGSWVLLPVGNVCTGWLASRIDGLYTIWIEAAFMLFITIVTMAVPSVRRFD